MGFAHSGATEKSACSAGTPENILAKLNQAIVAILQERARHEHVSKRDDALQVFLPSFELRYAIRGYEFRFPRHESR